jgi:hypothetical protein
MAGAGIPEERMCMLVRHPSDKEGELGVPISENTLRKHFRQELDSGHTKADTLVAQGLFKNATTPTASHPGGVPVAQIFWLKTRARWRTAEKADLEPTDLTPAQQDERETARRLAFILARGADAEGKPKKKTKEPA